MHMLHIPLYQEGIKVWEAHSSEREYCHNPTP